MPSCGDRKSINYYTDMMAVEDFVSSGGAPQKKPCCYKTVRSSNFPGVHQLVDKGAYIPYIRGVSKRIGTFPTAQHVGWR